MYRFLTIFCLAALLLTSNLKAQEIRGMYVNRVDSILGNPDAEQELLHYLAYGQFNSVSFYSLYRLDFSDPDIRQDFRSLIRRARDEYGITRFGAVSENVSGFIGNIHLYNQDSLTLPEDRLDHFNLEFEFWSERATSEYYCKKYLEPGGYPCNPEGALEFVSKMIRDLREEIRDFPEIKIEMYVGWLTEDEAITVASMVDRILIAVYREMEEDGTVELYDFSTQRKRLEYLGAGGTVNIIPIFTSYDGSRDDNLNSWLQEGHTVCEAWDIYQAGFEADTSLPNRENIRLEGYQWFKYSSMPSIPINLKTPGPVFGPSKIRPRQSAKYIIPVNTGADRYEWNIIKDGSINRYVTQLPELNTSFTTPGTAVIQVKSMGCGEISGLARKSIQILDESIARDTLVRDSIEGKSFTLRVDPAGLHLTIPKEKQGPFHIQAMNLLGKIYLSRTVAKPGDYYLKFNQVADSTQIINISIVHPGGAFSKKISILDQ